MLVMQCIESGKHTHPKLDMVTKTSEFKSRFDPATMAMSASPARMLWIARCKAVKVVEHAVSTVTLGPRRS